jgi:GcrA cell cycle regulator
MTDTANVWTDERLEKLKELWTQGLSISQIGEALGVSRNAIAGKAHRMGLPKRPSPISRPKVEKPKVAVPEVTENLPLRLELRQLEWSRSKCCWPTGDPKKNGFVFCGDAIVPWQALLPDTLPRSLYNITRLKLTPMLKRREDYTPPAFLVTAVDLNIDIHDLGSIVTTKLAVTPNPAAGGAGILHLDGRGLELQSIFG